MRLAGAYAAWFALDLARVWVEFASTEPDGHGPEPPTATTTGGRR